MVETTFRSIAPWLLRKYVIRAQDIVDLGLCTVYRLRHRCIDAEKCNSDVRAGLGCIGNRASFHFDRLYFGWDVNTGKDARCSDAVCTSCLAAHPDVFLNWSTPKGFSPQCAGSEEPLLPFPVRKPSMTRSPAINCLFIFVPKNPYLLAASHKLSLFDFRPKTSSNPRKLRGALRIARGSKNPLL